MWNPKLITNIERVLATSSDDIPADVLHGEHSETLFKFIWYWFCDTQPVTHGELDLRFLKELSPEEAAIAKSLLRRNLRRKYTHLIQGSAALGDTEAVPILRQMLDEEEDSSWRLTISGALWNLVRDPVFLTCLDQAKEEGRRRWTWLHRGNKPHRRLFLGAHLFEVLWLDDERAVDFLIDLLDQRDWLVRAGVLGMLNTLELGRRVIDRREMVFTPDDYRRRRADPEFRRKLTEAIRKWNREKTTGMTFGFREANPQGLSEGPGVSSSFP
jgi:hypothetical protein